MCQGIIEKTAAAFCVVCASLVLHRTKLEAVDVLRRGERGRGNISTWRKEEYTDHMKAFSYVMVSVEEIVLWKCQPYSSWITRSGNILFIVLLFLSSQDNEIMCLDYTLIHIIPRIVKMPIWHSEFQRLLS